MPLALFDMDYTLLSKSTSTLYVLFLFRRQMISLRELLDVSVVTLQYKLNVLDFPKATARLGKSVRDGDAIRTKALCDQFVKEDALQYITPKGLATLRAHQAQGDVVYLLSASTQFVVKPVAEHLGIPAGYTELEVDAQHKLTGNIVGPAAYGEGKRYWGEKIARDNGIPLSDVTFYTDSYSDLPLLEVVGHPVTINPDPKLKKYARQKGWRIEYFY